MKYYEQVIDITVRYAKGKLDYPSTLHAFFDAYSKRRTTRKSMAPLLSLLGCRNVRYPPGSGIWRFEEPAQPPLSQESVVTAGLLLALQNHMVNGGDDADNGCAILDGLVRNDRWRACLASLEGAHALAVTLLHITISLENQAPDQTNEFSYPDQTNEFSYLASVCRPSLYAVLNDWLRPESPFTEATPLPSLTCAMFGDIWYDLSFAEVSWFGPISNEYSNQNLFIIDAIHATRPPFLPGLLTAAEPERMVLPDLTPG